MKGLRDAMISLEREMNSNLWANWGQVRAEVGDQVVEQWGRGREFSIRVLFALFRIWDLSHKIAVIHLHLLISCFSLVYNFSVSFNYDLCIHHIALKYHQTFLYVLNNFMIDVHQYWYDRSRGFYCIMTITLESDIINNIS